MTNNYRQRKREHVVSIHFTRRSAKLWQNVSVSRKTGRTASPSPRPTRPCCYFL